MIRVFERCHITRIAIDFKLCKFSRKPLLMVALSMLSASLPAKADVLDIIKNQDTFHPYISTSITYDDNLFRLEKNPLADTIFQAAVGLNMNWELARQRFILNLAVNDNKFDRNKFLDYVGTDVQARWNWQLGNHLNGEMGYTNSTTLGSFTDISDTKVNNQRTQERLFFNSKWLFHPSWQLGLGVYRSTFDYGDSQQKTLNREESTVEASLQYLSSSSSKVGIKLRESDFRYPFRTFPDNGFQQHDLMGTLDWILSTKTRFQAQAGIVKKEGHDTSNRDFLQFSGRGTLSWLPSAKNKLDIAAWRNVSNYEDLATSYAINQGISLEPAWFPTSKTALSGRLAHETRDFIGNDNRADSTDSARMTFTYRPMNKLTLNANVNAETRSSNIRSYDDVSIGFSAAFEM